MGESYKKRNEQLKSFKDDPVVESLANNVRIRAEAVNNIRKKEGFSIAFLKEVTAFVSYMNGQAASVILACKQDISTSNKSFKLVVNEYLNNSEQLLDFCSALDKFVKSARDSHLYTQYVVQQCFDNKMETEYCLKILEKLKILKSSDDIHTDSAESLHQKIKGLIAQFEKLCKNLVHEIFKINEEKNRVGTQKKHTSLAYKSVSTIGLVFAGLVGADFLPDLADIVSGIAEIATDVADAASNTADAASCAVDAATHPHIESVQAASLEFINNHETASKYAVSAGFTAVAAVPLNLGHSLVMSHYDNKQKVLDNKKKDMDAIRRESESSIAELGDIKFHINQVVNEIDSLLAKTNTAVKMSDIDFLMKDMKQKLEMFMKKIDDLDAEAVKCSAETLKARDDVRNRIRL
ncbi:hypothetical protein RchiOBHm_Chr6g0262571 [Rosa chinensis]|uniref:Uncharacterized protein n=1 Tax=Rosa chinensis TaxID=74649 RepID=A0A2P6PNP4_ROSCH|nr:UPF0496 protein At4g34320 [Rosa chinensis]PRQ23547.1 hypothetical protein RchiOBHm_Chr6g0262571 [Rosa chinensis]